VVDRKRKKRWEREEEGKEKKRERRRLEEYTGVVESHGITARYSERERERERARRKLGKPRGEEIREAAGGGYNLIR